VLRRARESAHFSDAEPLSSHFASRRWFLPSQNQTSIHCLGPKGRHRRLSVCSLPVPKQSEGSRGSFISVAQSVSGGTWQSARCMILVLFPFVGLVFRPRRICHLLQARNPVVLDPRREDMRPSCALPQASLDWRSLSVSLFHRATQDRDPVAAPTSQPRSAQIGYSCCAVWISVCESTSRLSFFRHRRARNN
jgi:hypothetical protein